MPGPDSFLRRRRRRRCCWRRRKRKWLLYLDWPCWLARDGIPKLVASPIPIDPSRHSRHVVVAVDSVAVDSVAVVVVVVVDGR